MDKLTFGQLLDLLDCAHVVIRESESADEHGGLLAEIDEARKLIRDEIGASHMGTGLDVVIIEREDA